MRGLLPTIYMSANIAHSTRYALLHGPSPWEWAARLRFG